MSQPAGPLATPLPWDLVASDYAGEIVPHFERYARDAIRLALGVGARGARILDVACGPGTLALLAAREATRVTAVDFSPGMIAALRDRLAAEAIENVEVRVGDGQALDLPDACFDAAFSMFGLMFFPDRGRGLHEIRRVLVPGGRVAISSWLPLTEAPVLGAVFAALRRALPDLQLGDPRPPLGTAEEVVTELEAAGFRDAAAHRVEHAMDCPDVASFTASLHRTLAPLVLLRHRLGVEAFRPIAAAIDAEVAAVAGEGPSTVRMPAWIGVATA
jgi:ubiquinone/menaquinone biosynthesis C-methylase UbiE